jgi:hypothetical protein
MNIQDIKRMAQNMRSTIQNNVSTRVGRKLMIVAGGVTLLAGGAGTAMALQSHAQSRTNTTTAQVQLTNAADQTTTGTTGASVQQHGKTAAMGTVTAVSGSTITLTDMQNSTTYTVDASNATITKVIAPAASISSTATKPIKLTETTITASDIAVGDTLMVQGTVSGTSVSATKIVDGMMGGHGSFGGGDHTQDTAHGTVTAISGNILTVTDKQNSTTYTVDASNATVTKVSAPTASTAPSSSASRTQHTKPTETTIAVSAIAVGDEVSVQGTVSGTTITATTIRDGQFGGARMGGPHGGMGKPAVAGTVTAVSGSTLTVTDKQSSTSYTVDVSNATLKKINPGTSATGATPTKPTETTITASEITVGDTVMVQGTVSGTTVNATKIEDGTFPTPPAGVMPGDAASQSSTNTTTSSAANINL